LLQFNLVELVTPPKVTVTLEQFASKQKRTVEAAAALEQKTKRINARAKMELRTIFLNILISSKILGVS